jgi:glycosyltransferase involved in cell wall biosynthesis
MNMHVSIVTPLYNKQNSIVATLQSVLAQTYKNYEVIVVDDGSTDDSARVVKEFIDASRLSPLAFRLISQPNGGVSSARNRGIQEAKYDYIALLDGDDLWDEHYLEEQVKLIQDFPEAKMWGINFAEMSRGEMLRKLPTGLPDGYRGYVEDYFQMSERVSDLFHSSAVVIQKKAFEGVGYFDERIKYAEDCDMWFRIIATYPVAFYDRMLVYYRQDSENRALHRKISLKDYLPFFVDKYVAFKHNYMFYIWINRWSANMIRRYYFYPRNDQIEEAKNAVKKLDYTVIPYKYRLLFKMPYHLAVIFNKFDNWYHRKQK